MPPMTTSPLLTYVVENGIASMVSYDDDPSFVQPLAALLKDLPPICHVGQHLHHHYDVNSALRGSSVIIRIGFRPDELQQYKNKHNADALTTLESLQCMNMCKCKCCSTYACGDL